MVIRFDLNVGYNTSGKKLANIKRLKKQLKSGDLCKGFSEGFSPNAC